MSKYTKFESHLSPMQRERYNADEAFRRRCQKNWDKINGKSKKVAEDKIAKVFVGLIIAGVIFTGITTPNPADAQSSRIESQHLTQRNREREARRREREAENEIRREEWRQQQAERCPEEIESARLRRQAANSRPRNQGGANGRGL